MSATKKIKSGGEVTFQVKVNGSPLSNNVEVHSITIEKAVNRIASATLEILDGNSSEEGFKVSSSNDFVPGTPISIEAGYDSDNQLVFKGIVTRQILRAEEGNSTLDVLCKDEAVKMIIGRNSAVYTKVTDSDVISKLIGNHSLSSDVTSTSAKYPEMAQYYTSDWDFMMSRAEINGMVVTTLNGKVSVFKPDKDTSPVLEILHGDNLYMARMDMDAVTQLSSVKADAWDYKTQKVIKGEANSTAGGAGNLSGKELAGKIGGTSPFPLQTPAPLPDGDLTDWAKAQIVKREYAKIRGEVRFQGTATVDPGKYLTIGGMGDRFNGDYFVSQVVHEISEGNWFCEASLGISPLWFVQEPDVTAPPAAGLLPGIRGLFNATVMKINDDPDSQYRIQVNVPLLDKTKEGIWARLTNFYSTSGAGAFFLPEVGDEVILGFLNEDPRFPVILGSLYSDSKHKPYKELVPNEKNSKKAIVSKSELRLVFDDENKILTITTPGNNVITLDDKAKEISVKDENSNSMVMSSSGIVIKSPKTISIEADMEVNIKGKTGVNVESSGGDVSTKGLNIKETAQMEYSAEGSLTSKVQGGTELTLKGAMVMIN